MTCGVEFAEFHTDEIDRKGKVGASSLKLHDENQGEGFKRSEEILRLEQPSPKSSLLMQSYETSSKECIEMKTGGGRGGLGPLAGGLSSGGFGFEQRPDLLRSLRLLEGFLPLRGACHEGVGRERRARRRWCELPKRHQQLVLLVYHVTPPTRTHAEVGNRAHLPGSAHVRRSTYAHKRGESQARSHREQRSRRPAHVG